jgi:hypothetical protein
VRKIIDLMGQRFGKLIVLSIHGRDSRGHCMWECRCDCGSVIVVQGWNLRSKNSTSCGKCNIYYKRPDGYMTCKIKDGTEFIFDEEDYQLIKQYTWHKNNYGYICNKSDKEKILQLHRLLLQIDSPKIHIDHISHNPLDNRKCNLRICTPQQNSYNQKKQSGCSSQYKGVYFDKNKQKWCAQISCNLKHIHLGSFTSEADAALAYNEKAIELFGEFANLNIIER